MLDFYVKRTRFSHRDKRLFEIIEVEIMRVDCIYSDYTIFVSYQVEVLQLRRQMQEERLARHKAEQRVVEVKRVSSFPFFFQCCR